MLERRKEESESLGKYQGMLVSLVFAALIIFIAPSLVVMFAGCHNDAGDRCVQVTGTNSTLAKGTADCSCNESMLLNAPGGSSTVPTAIKESITNIYNLVVWVVRIVLVIMIMVSLIMLQIKKPTLNNY